jgi:hypothetical protein
MSNFPSNTQMAKNLGRELLATSRNVVRGMPVFVSDEIASARYNICLSCEHLHQERCRLCGCFMERKTKLETATCPERKW